jgi:hypothetical protein
MSAQTIEEFFKSSTKLTNTYNCGSNYSSILIENLVNSSKLDNFIELINSRNCSKTFNYAVITPSSNNIKQQKEQISPSQNQNQQTSDKNSKILMNTLISSYLTSVSTSIRSNRTHSGTSSTKTNHFQSQMPQEPSNPHQIGAESELSLIDTVYSTKTAKGTHLNYFIYLKKKHIASFYI